ncbi:MAG: protein kinase [Deltaproteobacteria bacterium]|nr:protein kinase [Deltaproteobacteria bacterium]MDQ3299607.1 protein kinase [Myxococcota bacterium]
MAVLRALCLDEDEATALVDGLASPPDRARGHAHIDECDECRDLVAVLMRAARPSAELAPTGLAPTDPRGPATPPNLRDEDSLHPGDQVGRYRIVRELGAGGMGRVYEAHDPELDRILAIKLLRDAASDGDGAYTARLVREARALARLAHPNVVAIHDVGTHGGLPFLAMEYVRGVTLRDWLERASRNWREVCGVFEQAARGLAAAHAVNLLHRDVKPDNIMVGDDGRVRVMDFGLARAADRTDEGVTASSGGLGSDACLTATGAIMGTPAYMSPEQHLGRPGDARSDQFNLMVALYEALYRTRPFAGGTLAAIGVAVTEGQVQKPPERAAPRWLRTLVLRGLATDPDARHPSMAVIADALARGASRRRRIVAIGGGAAVAIGAVAVVLSLGGRDGADPCERGARRIDQHWNADVRAQVARAFASVDGDTTAVKAADALDRYASQWRVLSRETCQARGSLPAAVVDERLLCLDARLRGVEALVGVWGDQPAPAVVKASLSAVFALPPPRECAVAGAAGALATSVPREQLALIDGLRSRMATATARLGVGLMERGLAELRAVATEASVMSHREFAAEAQLAVASAELSLGLTTDARITLERAQLLANEARSPLLIAESRTLAIAILSRAGDFEAALAAAADAKSAIAAAGEPERLRLAWHRSVGQLHTTREAFDDARRELDAARVLAESLYGAESIQVVDIDTLHGNLAFTRSEDDAARTTYLAALATTRRLHGDGHPQVARLRARLCRLESDHDRKLAATHCAAAVEFFEDAGPIYRDELARTLTAAADLDTTAAALAKLERARAIFVQTTGATSLTVATVTATIADHLVDSGEHERAVAEMTTEIAALERTLGTTHARVAPRLVTLSKLQYLTGQRREAGATLDRALASLDSPGGDPADRVALLIQLGTVAMGSGNIASARIAIDRALAIARGEGSSPAIEGEALLAVGTLLIDAGQGGEAIDYLRRALPLAKPNVRVVAHIGLAAVYGTQRKFAAAHRELAAALDTARRAKLDTGEKLVALQHCSLLVHQRRFGKARAICGAVANEPALPETFQLGARVNHAECELELGRPERARDLLQPLLMRLQELDASPKDRGAARWVLARAQWAMRDRDAARATAVEAESALLASGAPSAKLLAELRAWRAKVGMPAD